MTAPLYVPCAVCQIMSPRNQANKKQTKRPYLCIGRRPERAKRDWHPPNAHVRPLICLLVLLFRRAHVFSCFFDFWPRNVITVVLTGLILRWINPALIVLYE